MTEGIERKSTPSPLNSKEPIVDKYSNKLSITIVVASVALVCEINTDSQFPGIIRDGFNLARSVV